MCTSEGIACASLGLTAFVNTTRRLAGGEGNQGEKNRFEVGRLLSYRDWPSAAASASTTRLARAGLFYTGHEDEVRCYSCDIVIKGLAFGEDPFKRHSALSPRCLHVLGQDKCNVPINSPGSQPANAHDSRRPLSSLTQSLAQSRSQPNTGVDHPDNATPTTPTSVRHASSSHSSTGNKQRAGVNSIQNGVNELSMRDEISRLVTFANFPTQCPVRPHDLARAGFFYMNLRDRVKCAFCEGMVENWVRGDSAFDEHARHFPTCSFVLQRQRNVQTNSNSTLNQSNFSASSNSSPNPNTAHLNNISASAQRSNHTGLRNSPGFRRELTSLDSVLEDNPIVTERPKHPEYAIEQNRINTYRNWPIDKRQTPRELATAGFYYAGFGDNVKCFFCGGGLRNWEPQDDVWTEHARWFPKCGYVKQCKGVTFIKGVTQQGRETPAGSFHVDAREVKARLDAAHARRLLEMGYSKALVIKTIEKRLRTTGDDFPNLHAFLEALLEIEEAERQSLETGQQNESESASGGVTMQPVSNANQQNAPKIPNIPSNPKTDTNKSEKTDSENPSTADQIRKENTELKEQRLCKVCIDQEASVVLLPCAHLVCCTTCTPALTKCPLCRGAIRGTVKAFLA